MNHLFYLALKKSKLNKLIYRILKGRAHELIDINEKNVEMARKLLQSVHADPKNSCICQNQIMEPSYDLQIIIPAYNVEEYIKECLDSVLDQKTSFSYRVKVINDGSTDKTPQILANYSNRPEVEIINQPNKGLSGARNTGLKEINARYIMFLDSDDKLAPGAIEALLKMAQETDADIVEGSSIKFSGQLVYKKYNHSDCKKANANQLFGFAWGKVYKAHLFANIQFPENYWFEDTICALLLHRLANTVSTISHQVYLYRTNFKGISRTFRGKVKCLDSFYVCEQLLKDKELLKIPLNTKDEELIAKQFKLNSNRIASLKREDINKAVFILQCALAQKYLHKNNKNNELILPLLTGDYKAFLLLMKWL